MMGTSSDIAKLATDACSKALSAGGFKKRAGSVYTCSISPEVLGFVGLNSATNAPSGPFEINPVMGVRHQELEKVVAEMSGKKPHAYLPPTISTSLGYLMPDSHYEAWRFENADSVDAKATSLTAAINEYGLPYMNAHQTLEEIVTELSSTKHAPGDQWSMRISAGFGLLGDRVEARNSLEKDLEALGDRKDMAADYYRAFADAMLNSALT